MDLQLEDYVSLIECCAATCPLQNDMAYIIFHDSKHGSSKDDIRVWNALLLVRDEFGFGSMYGFMCNHSLHIRRWKHNDSLSHYKLFPIS